MIIDIRFFHFLACVKVTISFFHSNQSSGNSKIWHSAFCWLSRQNADIFVKDKIKLEFPNLWNTPLTNCINYLEDSIVQNLIIPIFGLPIIDNNFKALLRDFWPTPRLKTLPETRDKNLSHPRWNWENVANTSLLWLQQLLSEFTELVHLILAVINVRRWYFIPLL